MEDLLPYKLSEAIHKEKLMTRTELKVRGFFLFCKQWPNLP